MEFHGDLETFRSLKGISSSSPTLEELFNIQKFLSDDQKLEKVW